MTGKGDLKDFHSSAFTHLYTQRRILVVHLAEELEFLEDGVHLLDQVLHRVEFLVRLPQRHLELFVSRHQSLEYKSRLDHCITNSRTLVD